MWCFYGALASGSAYTAVVVVADSRWYCVSVPVQRVAGSLCRQGHVVAFVVIEGCGRSLASFGGRVGVLLAYSFG